MALNPYHHLLEHARQCGFDNDWLRAVCSSATDALEHCPHGDFPRWRAALEALPLVEPHARLNQGLPELGLPARHHKEIEENLQTLHPWRKGPLNIAGIKIDTEWRSDWKWSRVSPHIELNGARVLDIGSGNGYYGWRMLGEGAELVIGVDPTWVFVMQWLACRHFSGNLPNFVLPLGIEDLPDLPVAFDCVFSMGVLYHRRDAAHHLARLKNLLEPGGVLVLETLVLPDERRDEVLIPEGRYARMRNVWAVPGLDRLSQWMNKAGFNDVQLAHVGETSLTEQRSTRWMKFESLEKSLDASDLSLTIEGHPAPRRAVLIAR